MDKVVGLEIIGSIEANSDGVSISFEDGSKLDLIAKLPHPDPFNCVFSRDEWMALAKDSTASRLFDKLINQIQDLVENDHIVSDSLSMIR